MNIRVGNREDVDALVALNGRVLAMHAEAMPTRFRASPEIEEVKAAFIKMIEDPRSLWFVAEDSGVCGCIYAEFQDHEQNWVRPASRTCFIHHIVVHPEFQRKGIARRLLAAVVSEAEKRGVDRIELSVWSFNQVARRTFKNLGFQVFNERMEMKVPKQSRDPTATSVTARAGREPR